MSNIHPLAFVSPEAQLGENVEIGPYAYIDKDVVIGDNCKIHPHAVIYSYVRMGEGCEVFPGAVVGAIPQDLKYDGEVTYSEFMPSLFTFSIGQYPNRCANGKTYTIRQALRYRKNPREYANATFVFNVTLTDRNSVTLRSIDYSNPDTNGIEDMSGGLNVEGGGSKVEGYPVYDPQGRRLKAPQKGINIVSGRKLIVK